MGRLWSYSPDPQGHVCNGVLLGEPVELDEDPTTYEWDDSAFPNAEVNIVEGELVVTLEES